MKGRIIITQHGGHCASCKRTIGVGEHAYWRKGEQGVRRSEIFCMDDECGPAAQDADAEAEERSA